MHRNAIFTNLLSNSFESHLYKHVDLIINNILHCKLIVIKYSKFSLVIAFLCKADIQRLNECVRWNKQINRAKCRSTTLRIKCFSCLCRVFFLLLLNRLSFALFTHRLVLDVSLSQSAQYTPFYYIVLFKANIFQSANANSFDNNLCQ